MRSSRGRMSRLHQKLVEVRVGGCWDGVENREWSMGELPFGVLLKQLMSAIAEARLMAGWLRLPAIQERTTAVAE